MHATHCIPPGPVYPLLQVQLVSSPLPAPEYVFVGQALHAWFENCPVVLEYFPCVHSVQGAEPFAALYVPELHASQVPPSGPVYPFSQMHSNRLSLPISEDVHFGHGLHAFCVVWAIVSLYLPLAHIVHGADPFTSLYVPAIHAVHVTPSGPV
jgi:hypothetical protein